MTNLEPAKQPPEAEEVKRLYNDLWGRTDPANIEVLDKIRPITVGEVEDRIT